MAENPLLPHRRLKELYELMQRMQTLGASSTRATVNDRDATLSATALQLEAGDILCGTQSDLDVLASFAKKKLRSGEFYPKADAICASVARSADLPALCTTLASGAKAVKKRNGIVALATSTTSPEWPGVITQAQHDRLPLVLIIAQAATKASASPAGLTWLSVSKLAKKLQIPTIVVDGDDAVALYRVIQESLHRAKQGDGPALIWCAYPTGKSRGKGSKALANMESYLSARGLLRRSETPRPA